MSRDYSKMTVEELEKEIEGILELLPKEQHSDLFRAAVFMGQMELAKFIYHDQRYNSITRYRKSKTKQAEMVAFGQALVQLLLLMKVRGVDFQKTFGHAIEHMKDLDFAERKPENVEEIKGIPIAGGRISGKAYVVDDHNPVKDAPKDSIVVLEHAEPGVAEAILNSRAVVTDQGGKLCHMAILARENSFPAVIGTGNATSLIRNGEQITVDADEGNVTISGR